MRLLQHLGTQTPNNLLVCGDFNEICSEHDKLEGRVRTESQMQQFNPTIQHLGFFDLGFLGYPYTRRRGNGNRGGGIEERLDKALSTSSWIDKFPRTEVIHLPFILSDHAHKIKLFR